MTVYIDVLILLNTLVNYFMLLGVKVISRTETRRIRLLAGAVLGGISSLLALTELGVLATVIKIATGFLMVRISFPFVSVRTYIKNAFWLFLISFVFAGVNLAAYLFFDTDLMIYSNGTVYFDIDITFLTICTVASYIIISIISRFTDKKIPEKQYYDITLISGGIKNTYKGFLDTGNNLKEPFSFAPVVVTNGKIYSELHAASGGRRERVIPVSTVNGEGIMHAFRLDGAVFTGKEIKEIYLGLSHSLPSDYDVLLCPDLLGDNYEKIKNIT